MTDEEPREPERPVRCAVFRPTGPEEKARCEDFAERISHLHDGRWPVGSAECREVEEHLAVCPRCAEILEDYRAITTGSELIRSAETAGVDGERTSRRVRARLRRRVFRRRLAWAGAGAGFAAAAAVVIAVVLADGPPTAEPGIAGQGPGGDTREKARELTRDADTRRTAASDSPVRSEDLEGQGSEGVMRKIGELRRTEERRPADGVRLVGGGDRTSARPPVSIPAVRPVVPPLLGVYLWYGERPTSVPTVVEIMGVNPGSPAERAGLKPGDAILAIDGQSVRRKTTEAVAELIRRAGPGAKITITFRRAGKTHETRVVLAGER